MLLVARCAELRHAVQACSACRKLLLCSQRLTCANIPGKRAATAATTHQMSLGLTRCPHHNIACSVHSSSSSHSCWQLDNTKIRFGCCFKLKPVASCRNAAALNVPFEAEEGIQAGVQGVIRDDHLPELLWWQPQELRKVLINSLYHLLLLTRQIKVVLKKERHETSLPARNTAEGHILLN